MKAVKIFRQKAEPGRRVLAVSDIHGHFEQLRQVLETAAFSQEDLLVIVGDIIEKGPQSLKALSYVMKLYERGNVVVLAGNVDQWRVEEMEQVNRETAGAFYQYLVEMRDWKGTSVFDEMAAECGVVVKSLQQLLAAKAAVLRRFQKELEFLRTRPTVLEIGRYIFVHGGLPQTTLEGLEKLDQFCLLKYDNFMATDLCFPKCVVVGHWPVTLYGKGKPQNNPTVNTQKNIISIDGGCGLKRDGQLNLLVLPDSACAVSAIQFYSCDLLPVYRAAQPQAESAGSCYINWPDNMVEPLEAEGEFTYVRHISTGKELWVCSDYIYESCRVDDFTDYALPVEKGDILSLIRSTSRGHLVKKNGVTGWYFGALDKLTCAAVEMGKMQGLKV